MPRLLNHVVDEQFYFRRTSSPQAFAAGAIHCSTSSPAVLDESPRILHQRAGDRFSRVDAMPPRDPRSVLPDSSAIACWNTANCCLVASTTSCSFQRSRLWKSTDPAPECTPLAEECRAPIRRASPGWRPNRPPRQCKVNAPPPNHHHSTVMEHHFWVPRRLRKKRPSTHRSAPLSIPQCPQCPLELSFGPRASMTAFNDQLLWPTAQSGGTPCS